MSLTEKGLAYRLAARIAAEGPIGVADFMAEALGHPEFGYYMKQDPFGAAGDFTTAPEVSQMFGELIGLWCVNSWLALGRPTPFTLAELGPGRGTLMADAVRALETVPACRAAARVHLVETSPALRARQHDTLADIEAAWHDSVGALPMAPTIFIANEFFDALPIEQYVFEDGAWHERRVGLAAAGGREPAFAFTRAPEACPQERLPAAAMQATKSGAIAESSPAAHAVVAEIARRVRSHTGAALIVDYGYSSPALGDTLQAVRRHQFADVLGEPGNADLTAHVDFSALADAARRAGGACWGPIAQGEFLRRLGIETRAERLAAGATNRQQADIASALERLIGARQMGTLFKVMAIGAPGAPLPAGFLPEEATVS